MVGRHEVSDEQWSWIKDIFGAPCGRGRPCRDYRQILNGILWILRTGAPWRDLPERYGPWQTVYSRFRRWQREGMWDRLLEHLQRELDAAGRPDWELWCVDGTQVRASRAAAGAPKRGA